MSERQRNAGGDPHDLAGAPFLDDAERAEADWLVARDRDPTTPAPSPKIARDYAELDELLGSLPAGPSDERWHDEVLRLARASVTPPRPWWRRLAVRWTAGLAFAGAAAAAIALMLRPPQPAGGELQVAIHHGDETRGDAREAAVGDRLVVRARPRGPSELRVYRVDGPLVARCPAGPGCTTAAPDEHAVEITLEAPVQHHVILVVGASAPLPEGTMNAYLDAARAAGARVVTSRPIDVR